MHTSTFSTLIPTHLTLQIIKTLNSWLSHIIKICISEYNVEKIKRQYYNSLHYIFDTINNSHDDMDMEIIAKVCTSLFY
jgi:hypothetical protein